METPTEPNPPQEIIAGKLCIVASILILLGVGLFFLFEAHRGDGSCSFLILGLVVPFLGLCAIIEILSKWRSITNPDKSISEGLILKIADRFLGAGLLFAVVSPFPLCA